MATGGQNKKVPSRPRGMEISGGQCREDGGWEGVVNDAKEESGATEVAALGKAVTANDYVLTEVAASLGREKEQSSQDVQD